MFDAETAALTVDGSLRPFGKEERAEREKRYLKSDLEFIVSGVTFREAIRRLPADEVARLRALRGAARTEAATGPERSRHGLRD